MISLYEIKKGGLVAVAFAAGLLAACSGSEGKDVAGGSSEDAGITAMDVMGVAQKGPFVAGAAVALRGVDCKTLESTGETFEGSVESDRGEFKVEGVTLKSSCAVLEVTGKYLNEVSGSVTDDEISLRVLTDLKDRKAVNVNMLTHLEYERVKALVSTKNLTFAEAKVQAQREVLAAFDIGEASTEFESMDILEPGSDNAALLAVSVLLQGNSEVPEVAARADRIAFAIASNGLWDDVGTKKEIAVWAQGAEASGQMDAIRRNVEGWSDGEVAAFEKLVEEFSESASKNPYLDAETEYDTLVDARDGQVYRTLKIGGQTWMAENMNYYDTVAVPGLRDSSWCYDKNPATCATKGRLYAWVVAMKSVCPDGWHLPDTTEWNALIAAVDGDAAALKSQGSWDDGSGTNSSGFSAVAGGERYRSGSFDSEGIKAYFWSSAEAQDESGFAGYAVLFGSGNSVTLKSSPGNNGHSVRCVKD